jgi:hypothetical protein
MSEEPRHDQADTWFEVYHGSQLMQGDVLFACEVMHWQAIPDGQTDEVHYDAVATDVIVLTQSCDLEHEGKTEFVLLAEVVNYDALVASDPNSKYAAKSFRVNCARGRIPQLALLPPFDGPPEITWSLVDFSHLYTMPKAFVEGHAASAGQRLRMRSPYREHLSQAFGYYFMRVGLPRGIAEFENYKRATA